MSQGYAYGENKWEVSDTLWQRIYPKESVLHRNFTKELASIKEIEPEVTLLSVFCGRYHTLGFYFNQLENLNYPKRKLHLLFYCTSFNPFFKKALTQRFNRIRHDYKSAQIFYDQGIIPSPLAFAEREDVPGIPLHHSNLPEIYRRGFAMTKSKYLLSLEDDQISPSFILRRFLRIVSLKKVVSCCGVTFDRHEDRPLPIAFDFYVNPTGDRYKGKWVQDRMFQLAPVGSAGFGATLFDLDKFNGERLEYERKETPGLLGTDVLLGFQLNEHGKVVLHDWDVRSFHIDSKGGVR